jgi:hypothetical protein
MPLEANEQQRATLHGLLQAVLADATLGFSKYVSLERTSVERVTARLLDVVSKKKLKLPWLTNRAIEAFLTDRLQLSLPAEIDDRDRMSIALSSVPEFMDTTVVADRLLSDVLSLPWRYRLMLPTSLSASGSEAEIMLDGNARLVQFSSDAAARMPLHKSDLLRAGLEHQSYPDTVSTARMYFVNDVWGYIPETDTSGIVEEVVNSWKGLLGLLLIDGAFHFRAKLIGPPSQASPVIIYRITDDESMESLLPYKWLTLGDSELAQRLSATESLRKDVPTAVQAVVVAFRDTPTKTAARWFLDSFGDERGVLQIVQATVALEILLSDDTDPRDANLTRLLAARLAYLVGYRPTDRRRISADFSRLYDARSKIVHSGKAALDDEERTTLDELQRYAARAIGEQIRGFRLG